MNGQIIPEETEREIVTEEESAVFLTIGDKAYTFELIEEYNANALQKKQEFNDNATKETSEFNNNSNTKIDAFNVIAASKTNDFNTNAENQKNSFDNNVSSQVNNFNANATQKISEFEANVGAYKEGIDKNKENIAEIIERLNTDDIVINELQQENEDIRKSLITNEVEDTDIHITDSANIRINDIEVKGNHSQETTQGYNLLSNQYLKVGTKVVNGITFKFNEDGSIVANGTATENAIIYPIPIEVGLQLKAGSYTLSGCPSGGGNATYKQDILKDDNSALITDYGNNTYSTTISENTHISISRIVIYKGYTANNLLFKPQLESGLVKTEYEKYTGGVASPSPQWKQPINVVTGDNVANIESKNLFRTKKFSDNAFGINYDVEKHIIKMKGEISSTNYPSITIYKNTETITSQWWATIASIRPSNGLYRKNLTLTIKHKGTSTIGKYSLNLGFGNSTLFKKEISISQPYTMKINENLNFINIGFYPNDTIDLNFEIQLEYRDTSTDIIEHQEQNYSLSLADIELLQDEFIDGYTYNWFINKKWGKIVLNGTEKWEYDSNYKYFRCPTYNFNDNIPGSSKLKQYSNYFVITNDWGNGFRDNVTANIGYSVQNSGYKICLRNTDYDNVDEFKKWLSQYNTIIYYPLLQPTRTKITDETLIKQLNDIYRAKTYKGITNISTDTENEKPILKIGYNCDTKSYIDNKLLEIQSALVDVEVANLEEGV